MAVTAPIHVSLQRLHHVPGLPDIALDAFQDTLFPAKAFQDLLVYRILGAYIRDIYVMILAEPVNAILRLHPFPEIPVIGHVDDVVAEL